MQICYTHGYVHGFEDPRVGSWRRYTCSSVHEHVYGFDYGRPDCHLWPHRSSEIGRDIGIQRTYLTSWACSSVMGLYGGAVLAPMSLVENRSSVPVGNGLQSRLRNRD
jgi:hypothetical protein